MFVFLKGESYYYYITIMLYLCKKIFYQIFEYVQKVMNVQILCVHNIIIMNIIII